MCLTVGLHAQTPSDPAALLQQAQSAVTNKRYDLAAPLLEKILAGSAPSNVVATAQELRATTYQDWFQWLQQSQATLNQMITSNSTALTAAKEDLRKAREAFAAETTKAGSGFKAGSAGGRKGAGSSGGSSKMGKLSGALADEMKAVSSAEKNVNDLERQQQYLNAHLTAITRYSTQIQARMTELNIKPKAEQPPPTAPSPTRPPQ